MATQGKSGSNIVSGGNGNDTLNGGASSDVISGGAGNDRLTGGAGADVLDGGAGSDIVNGDSGDDTAIYVVGENAGARDTYDGGSGKDTLQLVMTRAEWMSAAVQSDIAAYLAFLAQVIHPVNGEAKNTNFTFSFGLTASKFENLQITVDGVTFDPRDQAVTLIDDVMAAGESAPSIAVDVLLNDSVPDLVAALTNTQPAHGAVSLTRTTGPSGDTASFVYTPDAGHWRFLAAGETATDSFTYTVTDADGDTATATVTVTITGTNEAPTLTSAVTGGATVEDGTVTAGGVIAFADVDLRDAHTVSSAAQGAGYLGTFTATVTDDGANDGAGSVTWDFAVDNAAIQYLAAGQSLTQTYTVTVSDGQGGSVDQVVTVTITGTNDAPVITGADASGGVVEAEPVTGVPAASTPVLGDAEVNNSFATAQTIDRAALRVAPNANLGDQTDASISVQGSIANSADQDVFSITLQAGEILTLDIDFAGGLGGVFGLDSFVFVYDAAGNLVNFNDDASTSLGGAGSIRTQDSYLQVTAGQTGTYYVVVKDFDLFGQSSAGAYTLQVSVDSQNARLTDTGVINFADVDLADGHSVAVAAMGSGYVGGLSASVSNPSTGDGAGAVAWTFSVANAAVQFLGEGQVLTQDYTVSVADGHGGTAQQVVSITLTGMNDQPVITSAFSAGSVVEGGPLTTGGQIAFRDVDLVDSHTVSTVEELPGYVGTFTAGVADASTGDGAGAVAWSFSVDDAAVAYLAAGQSLLQRYIVTIDDGHGGTTQQLINVSILGTNDAPVITSAIDSGATVEDGVVTAAGVIAFSDADLADGHGVASAANGADYLGVFSALMTDNGLGDGAGSVTWSYVVDNAAIQYLAAGQVLTQTYTVNVSDGRGGVVSQPVTVTITGTNDGPVAVGDSLTADEDSAVTVAGADLLANDSDVDGDTLSVVSVSGVGTLGTVQLVSGDVIYTPGSAFQHLRAGETAVDSFTYTARDPSGATSTATVNVVVNGANDAPTAGGDAAFVNANGSVIIPVLTNDSDPEGDALSVSSVGAAAHGVAVINPDGSVTYTPTAGYSGTDNFTYTVEDPFGAQSTASVSIVVGLSDHDAVGGNVFLQGNYMEIGVSASGSLGTSAAAPAGYHPQGQSGISYVVDADGWTSGAPPRAGDFTLPGSPVDTIVVGFNGASFAQDERSGRRQINTTTTDISTPTLLGARTTGLVGGSLIFTQTITLDPSATYYITTITVQNVSGAALNDVRFMRSFDPDQDQYRYGNYTTFNDVLSNPTGGNDLAIARAQGPNSGVSVNLVAFDDDARASNFGFANYNTYVSQAYAAPVDRNGALVDEAITLTFNFGNLAAGQSATKTFYTTLNGSSGANDMLVGTNGADTLDAGAGNDIIIGLAGNDSLRGGTGNDRFVFTTGTGVDRILDFTAGAGTDDVIELRGVGIDDMIELRAHAAQVGLDVVIDLGAGNSVTLVNVDLANLSADDFWFVG